MIEPSFTIQELNTYSSIPSVFQNYSPKETKQVCVWTGEGGKSQKTLFSQYTLKDN